MRFKLATLLIAIVAVGFVYDANAQIVIDFERPFIHFQGQNIADPYMDTSVSFTAEPYPGTTPLDEVTGLVYNRLSNACVEPADDNVVLGTGRELLPPNGRVGQDGYPIRASLRTPITSDAARGDQVQVSVDFQTVVGEEVRMRLYDTDDKMIKSVTGVVARNQGTCGKIGKNRGSITLTAVTQEEFSYARFDIPANVFGGVAYVIDNFVVQFTLGARVDGTPVNEELCSRLARSSTLPFTMHTANDCQNLSRVEGLGEGEFKAYVANMMKVQVMRGRDLCNVVEGGCPPCPIPDFICPSMEFVFYDVWGHDLEFTATFTVSAYDLDGNLLTTGQRQPDGGVRLFFTRPTTHSSGEEENFFIVLRPDQQGLPWKFDFWGRVTLNVENPDPLGAFDVNNNLRIDTDEFIEIMDQWLNGFIPDAIFFAGMDLWTTQLPLASSSAAARPVTFDVARLASSMTFSASNASSLRVQVFDSSGELIFAKWNRGSRLVWNMQDTQGSRVANGVYFAHMTSEDANGNITTQLKKIALVN